MKRGYYYVIEWHLTWRPRAHSPFFVPPSLHYLYCSDNCGYPFHTPPSLRLWLWLCANFVVLSSFFFIAAQPTQQKHYKGKIQIKIEFEIENFVEILPLCGVLWCCEWLRWPTEPHYNCHNSRPFPLCCCRWRCRRCSGWKRIERPLHMLHSGAEGDIKGIDFFKGNF